ncbi:nuclear pore protein 84/107 [Dactylonectria estremocensis]|uniref:Nuclear pore complex protein n=1 Tax=Dactylonectria estremocensis TaxID=1079267 RepID=A0A9P9JB72_9HYPO|nr:nuclear pore protein 84/107 [Dactylonectria estremocensis]
MELITATQTPKPLGAGPEVEDFANDLDDCLSPLISPSEKRNRILELPRKYHENALQRLAHARPRIAREGTHDDADMDVDEVEIGSDNHASTKEIQRLEREAQTWDLLRRLLPLRYPTSAAESSTVSSSKAATAHLVDNFLESDLLARERRAVIQWLQSNAASGPDIDELARELQQNADRGDIIAHGWLHTRASIKLRKSVTAWPHLLDRQSPNIASSHINSDGAPLVTQLDPDAATRQGRKLEPQDEYFERAIWLGCFEHLRRGSNLDVIREWCQERTEMWRAISTSAMLLPADDSKGSLASNPASLALWRRMCFSLARQGGCDDYERAVYGVLSGDISSVEKVALTWDDFLFANYNALLRTQLDTHILGQCTPEVVSNLTQNFSSFDAVQFHGESEDVEKRLIRSLESNPQIHNEAIEPNKAIQASLISKEIEQHLYEQGLVISAGANHNGASKLLYRSEPNGLTVNNEKFFQANQHDGLRIVAHVYLLITLLERLRSPAGLSLSRFSHPEWSRAQENILAGYTDYLRLAQLQELIPLYCSVLESPRSYEVLSHNLISETDEQRRLTQLKLIKKTGIDVLTFVKKQAQLMYEDLGATRSTFPAKTSFSIIQPGPPTSRHGRPIKTDFFGEDPDNVDIKHEHMVRSLEWLLLVNETWPHVFSMGTEVYKFFLRNMHLNAARQLMKRVSFAGVLSDLTNQDEIDGTWFDDVGFWAEHLERSQITDVNAQQVLKDARNFRELESLVQALDSLETIASLVQISVERPDKTRKFWDEAGHQIKSAKENMQPLLDEWLIASIDEGDAELRELRQAYLPETILAYISALHFAGTGLSRDNLLECMELAAIIAERSSKISPVFVEAGRMKELLEVFAACSKALAISTGEKRATGSGNKKLREMGWSRDLWSVKQ